MKNQLRQWCSWSGMNGESGKKGSQLQGGEQIILGLGIIVMILFLYVMKWGEFVGFNEYIVIICFRM